MRTPVGGTVPRKLEACITRHDEGTDPDRAQMMGKENGGTYSWDHMVGQTHFKAPIPLPYSFPLLSLPPFLTTLPPLSHTPPGNLLISLAIRSLSRPTPFYFLYSPINTPPIIEMDGRVDRFSTSCGCRFRAVRR